MTAVAFGRTVRVVAVVALVCAALVRAAVPLRAAEQSATAPELKAAFLYNFARFTKWPAGVLPQGAAIVFCIAGEPAIGMELEQLISRQQGADPHAVVRQLKRDDDLSGCHVLYAPASDGKRTLALLEQARALPILTVSDRADFIPTGAIAQLYVLDSKMRFAIDMERAEGARLRLSSKLLSVAAVVHGKSESQLMQSPARPFRATRGGE